jgi:hypothetical protein
MIFLWLHRTGHALQFNKNQYTSSIDENSARVSEFSNLNSDQSREYIKNQNIPSVDYINPKTKTKTSPTKLVHRN